MSEMSKQIYSYLRNENKILCNLRDVCDYNIYDVLDLLNSLSEENEQLLKDLNCLFRIIEDTPIEHSLYVKEIKKRWGR